MTLISFIELFGTQKQCEDFLILKRWGAKENAICPHCDCKKVYIRNHRMSFRCSACTKNFSVKVGTVFECSKIKLQKWFLAIYFISTSKKGMSSVELSEKVGCTQKTAWFMAHRIRESCIDYGILGGEVEMDETFIGGKEKNKHEDKRLKQGRGAVGKIAVMGAVSRDNKQAVAYPVSTVSHDSVGRFVRDNLKKGSVIFADECTAYDKHTMLRVNHGKKQYVDGGIHTNNIESFWATIKRGYIGIYHHWSKKHLKRYIDEFTFRYNNRKSESIIDNVLTGTIGKSLPYKRLING